MILGGWYWHKDRHIGQRNQTRKLRNKAMHIRSKDCTGYQEYTMGKGASLQQMVLGKLYIHMKEDETGSLPYIIQRNQFKWIKDKT